MSDKKVAICPATGEPLKISVVGDACVGKTYMILTHTTGSFPTTWIPTVFDDYEHEEVVEGVTRCFAIHDSSGQEQYDRLRPLGYPQTSVFLLCFSLKKRSSLENISAKWLPELREHCPEVPVLLVGTKKDARDESGISPEDGHILSKKEGLLGYMECSAKTKEGLAEVFQAAVKVSMCTELCKESNKCFIS